MQMESAKVKIYILAQGQGSRWMAEHGRNIAIELPSEYKQLIPMGYNPRGEGELLIQRTFRQLCNNLDWLSATNVTVIAHGEFVEYTPKWAKFRSFREPTGCILEGICRTKDEWEDHRIVFLLGDVIYSNAMMKEILTNKNNIALFGRMGMNNITGKEASEIFALSFSGGESSFIWERMRHIWFHDGNNRAKLWTLYDYIRDYEGLDFISILDDYTDDVDSPEEYDQFFDTLKEMALEDDKENTPDSFHTARNAVEISSEKL